MYQRKWVLSDEEAPVFERYLILSHFESEVEFNKKAMDGQLNDYNIKELNEEISYHKEQLRLATLELNKLIEDGIKQDKKIIMDRLIWNCQNNSLSL